MSALYTEYSLIFNKKVLSFHGYRITRPLTVSVVMQAFSIFCIGLSKWACNLREPGRQKQCRAGTEDGHSHRLYNLKVPLIKIIKSLPDCKWLRCLVFKPFFKVPFYFSYIFISNIPLMIFLSVQPPLNIHRFHKPTAYMIGL